MPIRLCACGFSGAMRTALRACISASARLPLPSRISASSLVATRLLGSSATMRRISASAARAVALGLADFVQHRQRAGTVGGQFQHVEAEPLGGFRRRPGGAPAWRARPAAPGGGWPRPAAGRRAEGCNSGWRAGRCRKGTVGWLPRSCVAVLPCGGWGWQCAWSGCGWLHGMVAVPAGRGGGCS